LKRAIGKTYEVATQKPFQPSAERIATILTVVDFRPAGENQQQENVKYHAAAGWKPH
jgi:hypothetical protein